MLNSDRQPRKGSGSFQEILFKEQFTYYRTLESYVWFDDQQEYQAHILICPGYSELREDKDLSTDRDLVAYFRNVIQKRLKTDD